MTRQAADRWAARHPRGGVVGSGTALDVRLPEPKGGGCLAPSPPRIREARRRRIPIAPQWEEGKRDNGDPGSHSGSSVRTGQVQEASPRFGSRYGDRSSSAIRESLLLLPCYSPRVGFLAGHRDAEAMMGVRHVAAGPGMDAAGVDGCRSESRVCYSSTKSPHATGAPVPPCIWTKSGSVAGSDAAGTVVRLMPTPSIPCSTGLRAAATGPPSAQTPL